MWCCVDRDGLRVGICCCSSCGSIFMFDLLQGGAGVWLNSCSEPYLCGVIPHNRASDPPPYLEARQRGGSFPRRKNAGKGPPLASIFLTAGACLGGPQIVKKGRGAPPQSPPAAILDPKRGVGGQIASKAPLQLWASWGWRALFSFLEKGGGARPVVSQSCVYLVRFDLLRRPSYCSLGQFDLLPS